MEATASVLTWDTFRVQMDRLSGLKFAPVSLQTHWEALQDMPEPLLAAAVSEAQKDAEEFPSPKMLKVYADRLRGRVLPMGPEEDRSVPAPERAVTLPSGKVLRFKREWNYYCDDCGDTGWQSFVCGRDIVKQGTPGALVDARRHPWSESANCGKDSDHLPHSWSSRCHCLEWNSAVKRKRERDVQMAAQRVKVKGDAA